MDARHVHETTFSSGCVWHMGKSPCFVEAWRCSLTRIFKASSHVPYSKASAQAGLQREMIIQEITEQLALHKPFNKPKASL